MRRITLKLSLPLIIIGSVIGVSSMAQAAKEHPLIKGYPGSTLTASTDRGFSVFKFVTGVNSAGASDDEKLPNVAVSGDLMRLSYENPRDRSMLEIITNYREGLEKAAGRDGGDVMRLIAVE